MNQSEFVYSLYHSNDTNPSDILSSLNCVEEFDISVSINATACRGKEPISDKRTTVEIKTTENFKYLDDKLRESFEEIWFGH